MSTKHCQNKPVEIIIQTCLTECHLKQSSILSVDIFYYNFSLKLLYYFDALCCIKQEVAEEPAEVVEDDVEGNQPFLMQVINQSKPQKSKKKPVSARGKPVKSKVRQSIEEPGYQRKWSRSSTAWSSYNQGELNTSSSLR